MDEQIKPDDNWAGAEGANSEGVPIMIRYRPHLKKFRDAGVFNTRIDITWSYDTDEESLMPTPGEAEVMDDLEDALLSAFEDDTQTILAYVMAGEGDKTWSWYTNDAKMATERLDDVLSRFEQLPLHVNQTEDADWSGYFAFIDNWGDTAPE